MLRYYVTSFRISKVRFFAFLVLINVQGRITCLFNLIFPQDSESVIQINVRPLVQNSVFLSKFLCQKVRDWPKQRGREERAVKGAIKLGGPWVTSERLPAVLHHTGSHVDGGPRDLAIRAPLQLSIVKILEIKLL